MAIELKDDITKKINPTAIQLALIGAMHDYTFRNEGDFEFHLECAVIVDAYYKTHERSEEAAKEIKELLANLVKAINDKAALFDIPIYEDNQYGHRIHDKKVQDNFNTVISEVARDLCSEVRVVAFRPVTAIEKSMDFDEIHYNSVIEIKVCDHDFIASMDDQHFHSGYYAVPTMFMNHTLIGYEKDPHDEWAHEEDVKKYNPPASRVAVNPFVMKALKNLCAHEAGKCKNDYMYKKALNDNTLTALAESASTRFGLDKQTLLLAAAQVREKIKVGNYNDKQQFLRNISFYHFSHLVQTSYDINALVRMFDEIDDGSNANTDYSVAPFGVKNAVGYSDFLTQPKTA